MRAVSSADPGYPDPEGQLRGRVSNQQPRLLPDSERDMTNSKKEGASYYISSMDRALLLCIAGRRMLEKVRLALGEVEKGKDGSNLLRHVLLPRQLKWHWKGAAGIKQLVCVYRKFHKLGFYTRCLLLLVLAITFLFMGICYFSPLQFSLGWEVPDACVADDCRLRDPLPLSKLSPNLLLVLIHASAKGKEKRDAIRETWISGIKNHPDSPIQYRFILGGGKVSSSVMKEMTKEAHVYKDILIFPTIEDSVDSLTNRTLLSFKYAYESFNFKYVLKCDDDTYVDLHRMATELQLRTSDAPLYWGYMKGGAIVHFFFGRYREFAWDVCETYLPYTLGGGYVLSREVTRILATTAKHLKRYVCEDVSVGAWLAPYNIELKHDARFNSNIPSRGCKDPYLLTHKVSPEMMASYHKSLVLEGKICSWRTYNFLSFGGYIYNWSTPQASKCCRINSFVP